MKQPPQARREERRKRDRELHRCAARDDRQAVTQLLQLQGDLCSTDSLLRYQLLILSVLNMHTGVEQSCVRRSSQRSMQADQGGI